MKTIIQLGRHGDILNLLPALTSIARTHPIRLVTHELYASLAQGIPGLTVETTRFNNPVVVRSDLQDSKKYRDICITQVHGNPDPIALPVGTNFEIEAWTRLCQNVGRNLHWGTTPLTVPAYDPFRGAAYRESCVLRSGIPYNRPYIAVCLHGLSSPYPYAESTMKDIEKMADEKGLGIIDIPKMPAPHFVDVLGVLEAAIMLISVDTGILHLGRACNVPTFALVNDTRSSASNPRPHWFNWMQYSDSEPANGGILRKLDEFQNQIIQNRINNFYGNT